MVTLAPLISLIAALGPGLVSALAASPTLGAVVEKVDVAVIGGGGTGTHAAIKLQQAGKKVVVIEKQARLGGATATYTDPASGTTVDYGVQAYWNISAARSYFEQLKIATSGLDFFQTNTSYRNFQTGSTVKGVRDTQNFTAYSAQLARFPYLQYSWNLPKPVPADLLLPFKQFVAKYGLEDIAYSIFVDGEGAANLLDQLTVNVLKLIDESFIDTATRGNGIVPAGHDNSKIYQAAAAQLGSSVLLSSTVESATRPSKCNDDTGVDLVVKTPQGQRKIHASKLMVTIPPLISNMQPFGLDATESGLFKQWKYSNYFNMLVNNTGLPAGYRYLNANSSSSTYNIPKLPAPYQVTATRVPGLFFVWYGSPVTLTQDQVVADVFAVIERLARSINPYTTAKPQLVEFRNDTPFKLVVPAEAIEQRFYDKLNALQGYRNTWYTGAAWLSHDVAELWNYTDNVVLPKLKAGCRLAV